MMYDLIIIGTGPAGIVAGISASRDELKTLFLEKESLGGELVNRDQIRTYPGFSDGISGTELRSELIEELEKYDPDVKLEEVEKIDPSTPHLVQTNNGSYKGKSILIATGSSSKELDVPGGSEYEGRGIFHCAKCDGPLYQNEVIAVVGGDNNAIIDSLFLSKLASEVIIIEQNSQLEADKSLQDKVSSSSNMTVKYNTKVDAVIGEDGVVDSLRLNDFQNETMQLEPIGGLYVHDEVEPNTDFIKESIPVDESGSIIVNKKMETEIKGIFAAGDVRQDSPREIAAAVGDGTAAAESIKEYIKSDF